MIIAICGLPGAGKTTLARALAAFIGGELVAWDDFETMTDRSPAIVHDWLARGAPFEEIEAPGLVDRLLTTDGLVIFDTLLGPAWPDVTAKIAYSFWLECPTDVALARKCAQLLPDTGAAWMRTFLETYLDLVAPTLAIQRERVAQMCDFRLDASEPTERLVTQVVNHLQSTK